MKEQDREPHFQLFKKEQMPFMKWLGLSQMIFLLATLFIPLLSIWTNWILVLKLEATCICLIIIISIIWHKMNGLIRKQFDEVFNEMVK